MLEQGDLNAIAALINQSQKELQKALEASMDSKLKTLEISMDDKLNKLERRICLLSKRVQRNYRTLNKKIDDRTEFLLEEIDRVMSHRLDRIEEELRVLKESYAVQQLEHKNIGIMAEQLRDLTERVERLEAKTA